MIVNAVRSTSTSTLPPTLTAMAFGMPIMRHMRRPVGIGHAMGTPALVTMSPIKWTKQPTPAANPSIG
jgi:hypothetical protein